MDEGSWGNIFWNSFGLVACVLLSQMNYKELDGRGIFIIAYLNKINGHLSKVSINENFKFKGYYLVVIPDKLYVFNIGLPFRNRNKKGH